MLQTSSILFRVGKSTENQWDRVPQEIRLTYQAATEKLYDGSMSVEQITQAERNIYNSLFKPYGLYKPVGN